MSNSYATILTAFLLASCAVTDEARQTNDQIQTELTEVRGPQTPGYVTLRLSERPWLGLERLATAGPRQLPDELTSEDAVTLPLAGGLTDSTLAARIEAASGLHVRLVGRGSDTALSTAFTAALADGLIPQGGLWTGSLDSLLDAWTSAAGYRWSAQDGLIEIVRHESRLFRVHALQGRQTYRARSTTQETSGGEGVSGTAGQSLDYQSTSELWKEIEQQVERLLDRKDETVIVSAATASLTVTARPGTVERVRRWLQHLNRTALRPVTVSAHVYTVRLNRDEDYEIGIAAALERIARGANLELQVRTDGIAIISPTSSTTDSLAATIEALNSAGTTSRTLSADIPSLHGQPAQIHELVKIAYLKELSTSVTDSRVTVTLVPGEVSAGFSLSYTALVTAPDEILVRFHASLRDRPTFTEFGTEGNLIQLPVYGDRAVQAMQRIRRGQTLVVSGFRDRSASADRAGSFWSFLPVPGGSRRAAVASQEQVLLLTAEIGAPLGISETRGIRL